MSAARSSVWRRDSELPYQRLEEETIVVDPRSREVHLLNDTAARVWELLAAPQSVDELVAALGEEYDAPADELRFGCRGAGRRAGRQGAAAGRMSAAGDIVGPPQTEAPVCADSTVVGTDASYAVVSAMQTKAFAQTVPLNVSLELTLKCNIRCLHCYNFDRDQPKAARDAACADAKPELTLPEILALLADLRAAGCLFLSLTGGEVLTYPHLFAVLDRARELNLAVQLLSNGTLLRPGMTARLAGYRNLLGVSISVYGATAEVHDGITQVQGSWRRTWEGAARLPQSRDRRAREVHRHESERP